MAAMSGLPGTTLRRTPALAATAAVLLLAAAPTPVAAVHTLHVAPSAPDPLAPLLALISLAAWSLLAWLAVVAAGSLVARLPGTCGRVAAGVTCRVAPAGIRRIVEVSFGITVAVGALGASPASASPQIPPAPPAATALLDWPAATPAPALDWNPPARTTTSSPQAVLAPVVVRPGDSLWAVASDHLPLGATDAQVAAAWPVWWAANRAAVGANPDLIHPGLQLHPPALSPAHR